MLTQCFIFRVMAVALLIAFKMQSENDCLIQANAKIADLINVPLNQFNLMEASFLQALAFDAYIPATELTTKLNALNKDFKASLLNNRTQAKLERPSEKSSNASTTDSTSQICLNTTSA